MFARSLALHTITQTYHMYYCTYSMQLYYIRNTYYQIVAQCFLFVINYYLDIFWPRLLAIFRDFASS